MITEELEEALTAIEQELPETVHDLAFFQMYLTKIRKAPEEQLPELLEELEEHLDLDLFA